MGLCFGLGSEPLHQYLDRRVFYRTADFGRQFRRRLLRSVPGGEVPPLVFQGRTELLMGRQAPALPDRTAPVTVSKIFFRAPRPPPPSRRRCAGASAPAANGVLCARSGGKTPPWRVASTWSFSSCRRSLHSRPSASTANSISRSERGGSASEFLEFLSFV